MTRRWSGVVHNVIAHRISLPAQLRHRSHIHRPGSPVRITSAPLSPTEEFRVRQRRYAVLMATRLGCVVAATATYQLSLWLALALMLGGAILPWCAVLIANDHLPRRAAAAGNTLAATPSRALTGISSDRIIDL